MKVYEAAVVALKRGGATAPELATVSRLQPDRSVHVKALAGLGKVRALQVETLRLQLLKVCFCVSYGPRTNGRPTEVYTSRARVATDGTHRVFLAEIMVSLPFLADDRNLLHSPK